MFLDTYFLTINGLYNDAKIVDLTLAVVEMFFNIKHLTFGLDSK